MRIERTATGLIAILALAAACSSGSSSPSTPPGNVDSGSGSGSGSGGGFDSGSGSGSGGAVDSGIGETGGEGPEAGPCAAQQTEPVSSPNGVLTNKPQITFTNTAAGAAGALTVVSAYFSYSNGFINWWGEAVNNGTQTSCIPLGTVTMDGASVTTTVGAPPYIVATLTQTSACVAPGAKGQFWGIQQGTSFASISAVDYSFKGLSESANPSTDVLVQTPSISGETVTGQASIEATIYNLGIDVYARDCRGVIVGKLSAFPGNLGTLTAGQSLAFTTNPAAVPFDAFVALPSWIEGSHPIGEPQPFAERLALRAQQEAQMRGLREAQETAASRAR